MQIEFVTDGLMIPSARYRCEQFFPHFENEGIRCVLKYGYGTTYNSAVNRSWGGIYKVASRIRRGIWQITPSRETDIIFLQRTALPHVPIFEEILAASSKPIVFDFDDSLSLNGEGNPSRFRAWTFQRATHIATHLIAGNEYLANAAGFPTKTTIIPTVIDTDKFTPQIRANKKPIIGWMGTSGNFLSLRPIVPALTAVLAKYPDLTLRIVSNSVFAPLADHPQVEQITWRPDTEVSLLQSFDIGLMPLIDAPVTWGKCAFKMIQYMSVGTPVIVSEVGANVEVFGAEAPPGLMLNSFDWVDALSELIEDQSGRELMGMNGRERVLRHYSIESVLPRYLELFHSLISNTRS